MTPRRFRVAFSFAGEKRDFVAHVAAILAARFKEEEILYDKYHKAEFSRSDLAFYLPELYHKESDLIVAVFCPDYPNKEWCGLEWNAVFDLLKQGHVQKVMPTRFGNVEGKGLYSLSGYTDLQHETPQTFATLIFERLALNEGKLRNHYRDDTITDPRYFNRLHGDNSPFDHVARWQWQHLSFEQIKEFVSRPRVERQDDFSTGLTPEELFRRLKFIGSDGKVCNGTFLCFGSSPAADVPGATTKCFDWIGTTGENGFREDKELRGGLLTQFSETMIFLKRALRLGRTIGDGPRTDELEIPEKVLEEVVANALVHRDYEMGHSSVQVSVYEDRIEFTNPGLLIPPLKLETISAVSVSVPRNPQIARIFYLSGIMERAGKGIQRISAALAKHGLPPPEFKETPDKCFVVIIRRPKQEVLHSPLAAALSTITPNNLPRLQPFFGREAELAQIRDALSPEARTWGALIDGPGGMGKTSLAIRAAQECPPGLFDRILFTSVKDRELEDDGVRYLDAKLIPGFLEMLSELARELKLPDFEKSPEAERPRLIIEALRPLKVLLILDNLESLNKAERDQLFMFVKRLPGGSKAILTSRRRLGSGAEALILDKLSQDAALLTLAELAKGNPLLARMSEAERIVLHTHIGGNPLLLRWTAGQLGRGTCRTFTDALAYLRSCPAGNDPLEFVFGDLAREFTDAETKVLCALTYFTQPATVEHIATVAGAALGSSRREEAPSKSEVSPSLLPSSPTGDSQSLLTSAATEKVFDLAAVETALRTLANRSLVVPDQEERAYTLVPMVADFLRKKKPEVIAETGNRLEKRAYAHIVENGKRKHYRFPILDAAWPTVAPAIPLFLSGPNPRLQIICDALHAFLEFTGRWDEWLALSIQAEARALAAGDPASAGWRAKDACYVHYLRQQGDAVLACAGRLAAHWTQAQAGPREQAIAIRFRGLGHQLKGDYTAALADARQAVELLRSVSAESKDVAIGLNDVAGIEHQQGDYAAAERDYREALRIARAVGDAEGVAIDSGNLAALALDREDWPAAEAQAREVLPLSEQVGRQELVAWDCRVLAVALVRQGRKAEALPHAARAVQLYTQLGSPHLALAQALLKECQS